MVYDAVILAAGSGTRCGLGYNKCLYELNGKRVIEYSIDTFLQREKCQQVILVVSKQDEVVMREYESERVHIVLGGDTRQESSYQGVSTATSDYVMIHDGARPYVSVKEIEACELALEEANACLLMVDVKDTIKMVEDGLVKKTLNRSELKKALTPQCFKKELIMDCLRQAIEEQVSCTDDAACVELFSDTRVQVVDGEYTNIKITTPEDLS